jgi:asparagine synthase (glutamine-hydrolysing)
MISGAFSVLPDDGARHIVNRLRDLSVTGNIGFSEVVAENLTAYCLCHSRLPGTPSDYYFSDPEHDIVVLISGYVYNKPEICKILNIRDDITIPEMIARGFTLQGAGFVNHFNGDFAIFIGLPSLHRAYLFRDHAGIRPLAYFISKTTLFFSSDILSLCRVFRDGTAPDTDFLLGYFKYTDYRKTPNGKINKLLPGHFLEFSESGIKVEKYWDPETIRTDPSLSRDRMLADLKAILDDAVRIRCDHRFNAGAHVSSGLDSGIVSALARREYPNQEVFCGFSWSPENSDPGQIKYDERDNVRKSCEMSGIRPVFSRMGLPEYINFLYQFSMDKWYYAEADVLDQAVGLNTNLIFSGWGGDEFISTGDRGIDSDLIFSLKWRTFFRRYPLSHFKSAVRTLFYYVIFPALGILDFPTKKSFRDDARYLKREFKPSDRNALKSFYFYKSRVRLHLGLLNFYHLQERCEFWYINGFRRGVEYRYPLLDKRIIEYMLKVPSEILSDLKYDRIILREISNGILPEEVRWFSRKDDPVASERYNFFLKEAGREFMEEINDWKSNPDLFFINFRLLEKDIIRFGKNTGDKDSPVLSRALVYIKALHEFTKKYRLTE